MRELLQAAVEAARIGVVTGVVVADEETQAAAFDTLFVITENDPHVERDEHLRMPCITWTDRRTGLPLTRLYVLTKRRAGKMTKIVPGIELVYA